MKRKQNKKKVITICTSASFYKEALAVEQELKKSGFKVYVPKTAYKMRKNNNYNVLDYKTWYKDKKDYKNKTKLMNDHFKKVLQADAILVINNAKNGIQGYIGGNVLMEIAIAHHYKKPIFLWNGISNSLSFEEEIMGINPVIINQDVSKIKIK